MTLTMAIQVLKRKERPIQRRQHAYDLLLYEYVAILIQKKAAVLLRNS